MDDRGVVARALDASVTIEINGFTPSQTGEIDVRWDVDAFLAHLEASGRAIVPVEATEAMVLVSAKTLAAQETCAAWDDLSPVAQRDYIACAKQMLSAAMIAAAKDQADD